MQQTVCKNQVEFEQASVLLLPIIDLPPRDLTCIFSTLLFIQDQAKKMNISEPCVTFDQPLWHKASGIIAEKNLNIICRLGGFHTLMNFLGAIGSGLEDLFELVYATNSVGHMMSGKAFARAIRGHFLVDSCLNNMLLDNILHTEPNYENSDNIDCLKIAYNNCMEKAVDIGEIKNKSANAIDWLNTKLEQEKQRLKNSSRTASLWVQYIDYVKVIKMYIFAERTGDWEGHLEATRRMLNPFAATGHHHYAKSGRM